MKAVLAFLMQGLAAAAVAFSGMTLVYGEAEYASVGPLSVSVDLLMKVVPGILAVLVPIITKQWPAIGGFVSLLLKVLQYRNPETANMLSKLSALEVYAQKSGCDKTQAACVTIREQVLKSVK